MNRPIVSQPDPELDLSFERVVDVPRELVWLAWTTSQSAAPPAGLARARRLRQMPRHMAR